MFKKILFALACVGTLTACNDDYKDWASPQANPQPATVQFGNGSVKEVGVIDMAAVAEQPAVKVCDITAPSASNEAYKAEYKLTIGDATYTIAQNGELATADLAAFLKGHNILRPVETPVSAFVEMWESNGISAVKTATSGNFNINVKPQAPEIESAYYITGTPNGWNNADDTYAVLNNGGDVYENPVFTCKLPCNGEAIEFKVTPQSGLGGDWSKCLCASETEGQFLMNNAGGNFVIPANPDAKFVEITFDMMSLTWSYKFLTFTQFLWAPGNAQGWDPASACRLESEAFDGTYTGYLYLDGEYKLTSAPDWNHANYGDGGAGTVSPSGGNLAADKGVYYVTVNLVKNTISLVKVNNMNLVGGFNGWNQADDAQQMTWDAENLCFVKENAGVTSDGWKFTINNEWGINLGGSLDKLVGNGDNISVAGNTVKLYPCRTKSDNIYATVE